MTGARLPRTAIIVLAIVAGSVLLSFRAPASDERTPAAKQSVERLGSIPARAELVFSRPTGRRGDDGFPIRELFVADSRGEGLTQITHDGRHYNHFAVAPDRRRIAAIRYDSGDSDGNGRIDFQDRKTLWILDLESREQWSPLAEYDAGWGGVDWSPDGLWVVLSVMIDDRLDVHRLHPDGTGLENLTQDLNALLGVATPEKWVSDVSVSFDGEWLALLWSKDRRQPNRIVLARVDGTAARFVTDGGGAQARHAGGTWGRGDFDPEMSPDGEYVCFQRATDQSLASFNVSSHDIMRSRIDGTELLRLSPGGNRAVHGICDWSADGRIVFTEWNEEDSWAGPVIVNPDGAGYRRLTRLIGAGWVRWIPPVAE